MFYSWEPPIKNPHTVDIYRVFWRPIGLKIPEKIDTLETELTISSLKEGVTYECVVKAGNHLGYYLKITLQYKNII